MKSLLIVAAVLGCAAAQFQFKNAFSPKFPAPSFSPFQPSPARYQPQYQPFVAKPVPAPIPKYEPFVNKYNPAPVPKYQPIKSYSNEQNARVLREQNEPTADGGYHYSFETDNGIAVQETGSPRVLSSNPLVAPEVVQGSYSYTSPEGKVVSISYIADENGYRAVGDAIPTSPPIPEAILRSLEYNARYANPASKY